MPTVKVNGALNALVHKGEPWLSIATIPDVCKTPTPGGPVPMPYPNISQSSTLSGGTATVRADGGNMTAIKGSKFSMSSGDEPGTLGGIKSSTFKQASTWLLYSFDVKLEGKNACRFTDKMFHNNENTVNAGGVIPLVAPVILADVKMKCGELGQYGEQKKNTTAKGKRDRDHIPAKKALLAKAKERNGGVKLKPCQKKAIENGALSVVIPKKAHSRVSPTYGGRGKHLKDHKDLQNAAKRDTDKMEKAMKDFDKECVAAYKKAAEQVKKITNRQYTKWIDKMLASC